MNRTQQAEKLREAYMQGMEALITAEVKRIMRIHKNLVSYTDQMGTQYFTDKRDQTVDLITGHMNNSWVYVYAPTYKTFNVLCDLYGMLDGGSFGLNISQEEKRNS